MIYSRLGHTDVKVSKICLGTMTFGEQNSEKDAHEQLDYALDSGINFIDTAELYAIPPRKETQGLTEKYIGTWIKSRGKRDKIILATKIAGPSSHVTWIAGGKRRFNEKHLREAVEGSLRRLQTDYIDLYQLHWPERKTNFFGQLNFKVPAKEEETTPIEETLSALQKLIQEGKIRFIGVSNETPWGVCKFLHYAKSLNLPRIVSIQNPYSLLNRVYEIGLAEFSHRDKVGLLAYSPLAFGLLSGKYRNKNATGRLTLFPDHFKRYSSPLSLKAAEKYIDLAQQWGLKPAQMALAFVNTRPFVTSNIIGATTMEQLKENIDSIHVELPKALLKAIDKIHQEIPNPAP
ncbi:MAG: NADP(H)-dependent aldo-keto reductase [Candidatus Hydrogenedentota bacterium]|nr:MAG: NADP(H)-dependent aldo-keto reductase [Candidatus Hydrogenedentota bacterium]